MRVLIVCEFSGIVRDEFRKLGHNAWSCDLEPSERGGKYHFQGDAHFYLPGMPDTVGGPIIPWDMIIAFPPCTFLTNSANRWLKQRGRKAKRKAAVEFVKYIMGDWCDKIAVENPIGHLSTAIRKPDQIIQPWQFGHGEIKATCLWLKGLPPLKPTKIVSGREPRVHWAAPGKDRWKERSRTLRGIARAMAKQWGARA